MCYEPRYTEVMKFYKEPDILVRHHIRGRRRAKTKADLWRLHLRGHKSQGRQSVGADTDAQPLDVFREALKFSLAVQQCVRKLNSYNRGAKAGRQTGLNVAVHLHKRRITINETTV